MDTNANSAPPQKPWALGAALTLVAVGAIALVYVLFIASSKPETQQGLSQYAKGEMIRLYVEEAPPPMPTRALRDAGVQSVAICFLYSFIAPEHEQAARPHAALMAFGASG